MKSSFLVYLKLLDAPFVNKITKKKKKNEHLFCHYFVAKALWNSWNTFFENHLSLYDLKKQAAFFGFSEKHLDDTILQNHLLLVFKIYLYKSQFYAFVCLKSLILEIEKVNRLEKKIAEANANKNKSYLLKWNEIDNQLTTYNWNFFLTKDFPNCFPHGTLDGWMVVDVLNFVFIYLFFFFVSFYVNFSFLTCNYLKTK